MPYKLLSWLGNNEIKIEYLGSAYEKFNFPEDYKFDYQSSSDKFKGDLFERFPNEKEAIIKYFSLVREAAKAAKKLFLFKTFPLWLESVIKKVYTIKGAQWWCKTTEEVLDGFTNNQKLKSLLSAIWGYYGSVPHESSFGIHALVVRHFWNGGYYPKGGSATIAQSLLKTINGAGGDCVVRAKVKSLIVENNTVKGGNA